MFLRLFPTNKNSNKLVVLLILFFGLLLTGFMLFIGTEKIQKNQFNFVFPTVITTLTTETENKKQSKWPKNILVVVPAIWREIKWNNRSSWPAWLQDGLGLTGLNSRPYYVHLYQRVDPNSTAPYDWPFSFNIREETGVYLQFIHDFYYDLPDKMLFIHGNPFVHTNHNPVYSAQCFRDDVQFASVNDHREFIRSRPWYYWPRDPDDQIAIMYKCAKRLLTIFGFDAEKQLNPSNRSPKDDNVMSGFCCAQFYVTKQRIHRYTYEQWEELFRARMDKYCTTPRENERLGDGIQWYGGAMEHLWHVILGLYPTDAPVPVENTTTGRCQWFRPGCKGSPCN